MALSDEDVREILRIIDESDVAELEIETEGFALHVVRGMQRGTASRTKRPRNVRDAMPPRTDDAPELTETPEDGLLTIEAPMLGTFYRAEGPGKEPFVTEGSRVEPDTIVCIIEVMKMMNSVPAGVSGTVAEVCQENAQLVEYGQPLFRVKP
jgi:acetyl-CoA carboxylase biotin carboxyl carrier protein